MRSFVKIKPLTLRARIVVHFLIAILLLLDIFEITLVKPVREERGEREIKRESGEKKRHTAIICVIVKDEERYLKEWILYHLGLGFDKIYLYDNSLDSATRKWLETQDATVQLGTVVHHFPSMHQERQLLAYKDCIEQYGRGHNHTWAAFFDPDEFLVLKKHETVVELLQSVCPNGSVSINWIIFGTSNHTQYEPIPVTQRFQYHIGGGEETVKTIVKVCDYLSQRSPHWAYLVDDSNRRDTHGNFILGKRIAGVNNPTFHPNGPTDIAVIHHYKYKSEKEFNEKYCFRGDVWQKYGAMEKCLNETQTVISNLPSGHIYDASAWLLLKKNCPELLKTI